MKKSRFRRIFSISQTFARYERSYCLMSYFTSDHTKSQENTLNINGLNSAPLSKAHIRPFNRYPNYWGSHWGGKSRVDHDDDFHIPVPKIEYYPGASLIRTTKDIKMPAIGGGLRGGIKGFSIQSRRRLMELIATVKRDAELPDFVTLTYPNEFPTVERSKRDLKVFFQRFDRKYPQSGKIWKLEPQERGAPHFHMLVWGCDTEDLFFWVLNNWFDIAGHGDPNHYKFHAGLLKDSKKCVTRVNSFRGVWSYASKYIGKTFEVAEWGSQWTGRFWGVSGREFIPIASKSEINLSKIEVTKIMRLQRRFMNMKTRTKRSLNSLKTFCNANFWVDKLVMPGQNLQGEGARPQLGGVPLGD
jgi:hypothetical protein